MSEATKFRSAVLAVHKPAGPTSRHVVDEVGRLFPKGTRLGHAGTLDPAATGVLVICLGSATRLIRHLHTAGKSYRAAVRLGATSDTLDAEGQIAAIDVVEPPTRDAVQNALIPLTGLVEQLPPAFSALKIRGERAYDLARRGESPDLAPRQVQIDRIELWDYAWPIVELEIDCGSGTYIRSIARDLGASLGVGGLLQSLTRTSVGDFKLAESVALEDLNPETVGRWLRPPRDAISHLPTVALNSTQVALIRHGRTLDAARVSELDQTWNGLDIALLDTSGGLVGIGRLDSVAQTLAPNCVLPPEDSL